jgi:hypothetical protein
VTRSKYYAVVMPIAGLIYVALGVIYRNGTAWAVGALLLGIAGVAGLAIDKT